MPVFFRIVLTDPPRLHDFLSDADRGRPQPPDAERQRLWRGLSVYATEAQARRKARGVPMLGRFIAALNVPDDGDIAYERTTSSAGHYTIWADAAVLLDRVRSVVPVQWAE